MLNFFLLKSKSVYNSVLTNIILSQQSDYKESSIHQMSYKKTLMHNHAAVYLKRSGRGHWTVQLLGNQPCWRR